MGMSWQVAKAKAEAHIKANGRVFPGFNALIRQLGCGKTTLRKAITNSQYLKAREAEHKANRARGREVPMSDQTRESTTQTREVAPQERAAVLDELTADQRADEAEQAYRRRAASRQRSA